MRRTLRDLADARKELLEIQQGYDRLEKRIDAVRDCVTDSLTRIFGEEHPAIAALAEEELIEKLVGRVAARLGSQPAAMKQIGNRYIREKEAAAFLAVSVSALRSWRGRGCHLRLLKTRTAQYGSTLRRFKRKCSGCSTPRANGLSFLDVLFGSRVSFGLATLTMLGVVCELLVVEKELLTRSKNEVGVAVHAF